MPPRLLIGAWPAYSVIRTGSVRNSGLNQRPQRRPPVRGESDYDRRVADDGRMTSWALLAAIGLAAGVLSGLFGVGGGIVMVPALVMVGLGQHRSQATSLAAIVPIAAVGAILFGRADSVDLGAAVVLAAGSMVGVRVGALLMHRLSEQLLARVFAVFLVVVALTMLVR
jgi:uncharacterized membrane protein YfcA